MRHRRETHPGGEQAREVVGREPRPVGEARERQAPARPVRTDGARLRHGDRHGPTAHPRPRRRHPRLDRGPARRADSRARSTSRRPGSAARRRAARTRRRARTCAIGARPIRAVRAPLRHQPRPVPPRPRPTRRRSTDAASRRALPRRRPPALEAGFEGEVDEPQAGLGGEAPGRPHQAARADMRHRPPTPDLVADTLAWIEGRLDERLTLARLADRAAETDCRDRPRCRRMRPGRPSSRASRRPARRECPRSDETAWPHRSVA
jgi:hypothetical protein